MRFVRVLAYYFLCALASFAQTDRSTITGTMSDPGGAVVANAAIQVRNPATGAVFAAGSSGTGNFTVSIPPGTYELNVTVTGFKKYVRTSIEVPAATTVRQDVTLEVGATSDTITVVDSAPLIRTENAEISTIVKSDTANVLPVLTLGGTAGFGSIRNPLAVTALLPGVQYSANFNLRVNGLPSNTSAIRVEGQDATNGIWRQITDINQQGQEAIQEVAIQTSNYAAEFGQAAGGYFNFSMKSGTNQFHGSAYDYFVNEFLNAGTPYTDRGTTNSLQAGQHVRNPVRRNDYGFTIGGPVKIPKIYDGHDKTFFFFNWEQYRESRTTVNGLQTVPTAAFMIGEFSAAQPVCSALTATAACPNGVGGGQFVTQTIGGVATLAHDGSGAPIPVSGVYDPAAQFVAADGTQNRKQFVGNQVPITRMDPISLKVQALLPLPNSTDPTRQLINNYNVPVYSNTKISSIPSIKIDHNFSSTIKVSGYVGRTLSSNPNGNGLDPVLTSVSPQNDRTTTSRVNYDQTLAPTLLLHVGVGYQNVNSPTIPPAVDPATLGLIGYDPSAFPNFAGLLNGTTGGTSIGIGAGAFVNYHQWDQKPTANTSLTWVKGNHTFKFGGEYRSDGIINKTHQRANGNFTFGSSQTGNLWENGQAGLTGASGFPYASFLLGTASSLVASATGNMRIGNHALGFYAQDTWKVTRKLTIDYGLRYDFQTYLKEQYGRMQDADFDTNNTLVNHPGTLKYEANCNCNFSQNYPNAFGPRLGIAYQIDSKTVIRGGTALSYGTTSNNSQLSLSILDFYTFNAPGYGQNALQGGLAGGNPYRPGNPYGNAPLVFPDYNPNKFPIRAVCAGKPLVGTPTDASGNAICYTPNSPFISLDNDARPPRIFQYDITLQREIMRDLVIEAAYVGNRGAWFTAPALNTTNFNALQIKNLSNFGLDINNPNDRLLLTSPIGNINTGTLAPGVIQKGLGVPYAGFPIGNNLVTALIPRPQWGATIPPFLGPPLGRTWYDSFQLKATKRYSHGLDMQASYTYAKELSLGGELGYGLSRRSRDHPN